MAADTPFVGTEAAETLASHIQKRLLVADTMPASPAEGQVVLYAGATTASFTQGGIYLYDGEAWHLISAADIDLSAYKKQHNMTTAEWEALSTEEKVAMAGQNVVIKDDEGTQTFEDIIPSNASVSNKLVTESEIGDLADLETTAKEDVVSAINEVVSKVQSRPIVTIVTTKSENSDTSELMCSDLASAGVNSLYGSYLVTVHRNTSSSLTYFIGWIDMDSRELFDCSFHKLAGQGTSVNPLSTWNGIRYTGGDEADKTTWVFQPIGDAYTDY